MLLPDDAGCTLTLSTPESSLPFGVDIRDLSEDFIDYASCYRISLDGFMRSRPLRVHYMVISMMPNFFIDLLRSRLQRYTRLDILEKSAWPILWLIICHLSPPLAASPYELDLGFE
jgi:hypothetical protein